MPVLSPHAKKSSIVHRSESLRSEVSDASQASKRVSFNRDVAVKRIPRGAAVVDRDGKLVAVLDSPSNRREDSPTRRLWVNNLSSSKLPEEELLREAQSILKQVDSVTCSASPYDTRSLERKRKRGESTPPSFKPNLTKSPSVNRLSEFLNKNIPSKSKSRSRSRSPSALRVNGAKSSNGISGSKSIENLNGGRKFDLKTPFVVDGSKSDSDLLDDSRRVNYKKVGKIKKPHGGRVALNSIGETPRNSGSSGSSGSGSESKKGLVEKTISISESPVSSISGPEDTLGVMAGNSYNPRVSSIVQQLSRRDSPERVNSSSIFHRPIVEPGSGNTHNNNKPFSYITGIQNGNGTSNSNLNGSGTLTRGRSPTRNGSSSPKTFLRSPKEVIYAQVVVSGKPGDNQEKRTVHTRFNGDNRSSNTPERTINHFVYDSGSNKENHVSRKVMNGYESLFDAKPRHNVTTVLLNSEDEVDRAFQRDQTLFSYRNRSASPTPPRNFYYGENSRTNVNNGYSAHHNKTTNQSNHYYNERKSYDDNNGYASSREVSPTAAKLVREADRKKDFASSSKLHSSYTGTQNGAYEYMKNGSKVNGNKVNGNNKDSSHSRSHSPPNQNGDRGFQDYNYDTLPRKPKNDFKAMNGKKEEVSVEKKYNKKNKMEENVQVTKTGTLRSSTAGLISTLMRRNKDKKKEKVVADPNTNTMTNNKDTVVVEKKIEEVKKRQRAKFLSAFLDKNFSSKKKEEKIMEEPAKKNGKTKLGITTDSEIEEVERRRDGEYHSWSSGDDEYRFGRNGKGNNQITRGKSYHFGDYNKEPKKKIWYDQNDSDYRREMATSRYNSATLGRPNARTNVNYDSDPHRSKSLDRRMLKNRSPPKVIITPNTPQIIEEDPSLTWRSSLDVRRDRSPAVHPSLTKKNSGLSKSSYELDENSRVRGGKLRYFGDTDGEEVHHGRNYNHNSNSNQYVQNREMRRNGSYLNTRNSTSNNKYHNHKVAGPSSSLNSSESENGSRVSKGSSNGNGSQRSVYLHAAAVADIPPSSGPKRTLSRDELSNHSGPQRQSKQLARSMSVLAPWHPRHYREKYEVHYNNEPKSSVNGRPPKPPRSPNRKSMSPSPARAVSSESLLKIPENKRMDHGSFRPMKKSATLGRVSGNSVSRSKSMPKDSSFGGWLRRRGFNSANNNQNHNNSSKEQQVGPSKIHKS